MTTLLPNQSNETVVAIQPGTQFRLHRRAGRVKRQCRDGFAGNVQCIHREPMVKESSSMLVERFRSSEGTGEQFSVIDFGIERYCERLNDSIAGSYRC